MQEGTPTQWDQMSEVRLPWSIRLFDIYLAVVLLAFCFRAIRMLWHLHTLRKSAQKANGFQLAWDSCHARTVSMKNWSALTFLLSFLVPAWNMTETLRVISDQKVIGTAFLASTTAQVLTTFCLGMFVCAILYAFAFFCEARLARYKSQQSLSRQ